MTKNEPFPSYIKYASFLIILVAIFFILTYASNILITLTLSLFFAFLLLPISQKLESWSLPSWLAILISIIVAFIVFGSLLFFFGYQILSFKEDIPELEKSMMRKISEIEKYIEFQTHISKRKQTEWLNEKVVEYSAKSSDAIMVLFSTTGDVLTNMGLIPLYIFFLTLYREKFIRFAALILEGREQEKFLHILRNVSLVSQNYIKGIIIDVTILSFLNSTGFLLLGLKQAILFGTLAALLNIIPYVGVLIGSLFPIAIALLTKDSVWYAVGAAGVCFVVQFIDNNFITPKVVGSSVSLNPLTTTIALLLGAKFWGIMGMVLFIPLTGMLKVLLDNVEQLKPYGYLMGEEQEIKTVSKRKKKEVREKVISEF